jgi:hypothetical protein
MLADYGLGDRLLWSAGRAETTNHQSSRNQPFLTCLHIRPTSEKKDKQTRVDHDAIRHEGSLRVIGLP